MLKKYKVGLIYIGTMAKSYFQYIWVNAYSEKEACNIAVNYLKPNHMQTLTIVETRNFAGECNEVV